MAYETRSFTIDTPRNGLTDALLMFSTLYRIGRALGYDYRHRNMRNRRSDGECGPGAPSVLDQLGINAALAERFLEPGPEWRGAREIELTGELLKSADVDAILSFVAERAGSVRRLVFRPPKVFALNLHMKLVRAFPELDAELDIGELLRKARLAARRGPRFSGRAPRWLAHCRQGDVAIVSSPWGGVVACRPNDALAYRDVARMEDLSLPQPFPGNPSGRKWISPQAFGDVLDHLAKSGPEIPECQFFSDGFERSFDLIALRADPDSFGRERFSHLMHSRTGYDDRAFACLAGIPGLTTVIGEEPGKLIHLIDAFMEADVVIFGIQQLMMLKLALLARRRSIPTMIVLSRERPRFWGLRDGAIPEIADDLILIDIDAPNLAERCAEVVAELGAKSQRNGAGTK